MKVQIIKHIEGLQIQNTICEVKTRKEMEMIKNQILDNIHSTKTEIISACLDYEEINDGTFYGFISDSFQVIQSEKFIDIQDGNKHIQYIFSETANADSMYMNWNNQFQIAA